MNRFSVHWVPGAKWFAGVIVIAVLVFGAGLVHRHAATTGQAAAPAASTAAMRVAMDPETGTLGLAAGEAAGGLDLPAEPQGEAPSRLFADGTLQIDMRGRGRTYAVAQCGADGKIATGCATDANDVRQFLLGAGAAAITVDGRDVK